MTTELFWLTLIVLNTGLFWVPYILDRIRVVGLMAALTMPKPEPGVQSPWADRAMKAHANAVENLAIFAPAVLTAHVLNIHTPVTRAAAIAYFIGRTMHFIGYTNAIPFLRPAGFGIGCLAQMAMLLSILGWI